MGQNTKKFCGILDKLGDQFIEIVNFYNEAEEIAEVVLELNYEDTCYHTNITINDDLTATVNQERKDNLTEEDCPPDDYNPFGIDGLSESKSWNLSKYEVSCELTTIILPRFEDYLAQIKDSFDTLQKLKLGNSTSTEVLGMIKNLYDVGVLFVTGFKKYKSSQQFVDDLKMYFSQYCDLPLVCGRIDEFKVRMGFEPVKPAETGHEKKAAGSPQSKYIFRKQGPNKWLVKFEEETCTLDNLVGVCYMAQLLARKNKEISAMELYQTVNPPPAEALKSPASTEPVMDNKYLQNCAKKLKELRIDLGQAKKDNDLAEVSRVQQEIGQIEGALSSGVGLRGRLRELSNDKARVRSSVTMAINRATKPINNDFPKLYQHLKNSIHTGETCSYKPDRDIDWQL